MMPEAAQKLEAGPTVLASPEQQCARIDTVIAHLSAPVAQIDSSFVSVGEELLGCSGLLSEVAATFEALPKDLESTELVEATQKLGEVIRHASAIASGFGVEQADLDALVTKVDAARAPMATLRKIIQMIGILAINARVVAASVAAGDDEVSVFTTDIAELSKSATGTIRRFFKAYEHLSTDLHKAATERARFQAAQQDALEQAARRLSDNFEQVSQRRERSTRDSADITGVTRDISARIGTAVVAMQVGDSTRQRIEHVVYALNDIKDLIGQAAAGDYDVPEKLHKHGLATVLHLQDQLLEAARTDYENDIGSAERAMGELAATSGTIVSLSRDLYGQKERQGESALGALSSDMRQVAVMLKACEVDRRKLDAAAVAVGEMVGQLLSHVEEVQKIEGSMRLVTLNAAVKCAQLGPRGKALDVIAKQLRELTGDTVTSAKAALSVLNEAAERARNMAGNASGEVSGDIAELLEESMAAIGLFEQVDHRLSAALRLLDEKGALTSSKLAEAERRFAEHLAISESLADAQLEVAALSTEVGGPNIEAVVNEELGVFLLNRMRENYTMESERRIHDGVTGFVQANDAPAESAEPAGDDDDMDLGLF